MLLQRLAGAARRHAITPAAVGRLGAFRAISPRAFSTSSSMSDSLKTMSGALDKLPRMQGANQGGDEITLMDESPKEFLLRWCDVFGHLTMFFNRKVWVLMQPPQTRANCVLTTEYERKYMMFQEMVTFIFTVFTLYMFYGEYCHLSVRPPFPQLHAAENYNHMNVMFDYLCIDDVVASQCNQCRWVEADCKKICYDKLRELGYDATYKNQAEWSSTSRIWKLVQNGGCIVQFNTPKTQSFPYI